ncbi:MAG: NUDIX hydrolase N-terminal domain-containing protein [Anaerolineae bacterium]|nr:NUDIX hydrolase N-terminal domain-containing protein [Anaerolineae bacterium]
MTPAETIARWADKLRDISALGLKFSQNIYDLENYRVIQNIALEMFALATGQSPDQIEPLREPILSRPTPFSVGDAAVINNAGEILLIQRADSRKWALPGGAMSVGETPAEGVAREALEETGVRCQPIELVGVYDSRFHRDASPHHLYVFVFLCQLLENETEEPSHALEILDQGWFAEDNLPAPLELSHIPRIRDAFETWRGNCRAFFDGMEGRSR